MVLTRRIISQTTVALLGAHISRAFAQETGPLRIGALNPVTGAGSLYGGGMQKAIILAANQVNAAGGITGRKVEVFAEDTETSPPAAVLAAKKLIDVNKVHAILGTWSSGDAAAIMPLTDAAGIPHLTNAGATNVVSTKGLMFRFSALSGRIGEALGGLVAQRGFTAVATMAINNPSGLDIVSGFKTAWTKLGRHPTADVVYQPNQPSYRSEVQQILASDPAAIVLGGYLPDFTVILREARQAGSDVKFFVPAWTINQKMLESLGPDATQGIFTYDYVAALDSDAFKSFAPKFKEATGSDPADNYFACCAYDMMVVTALAAAVAGPNGSLASNMRTVANPPGTNVYDVVQGLDLLRQGKKVNYEGASGPIDFDADGNVRPLFKLSEVKDGKVVTIGQIFQNY
jgi:branched-chain amino acid transport system substrate-binding protein